MNAAYTLEHVEAMCTTGRGEAQNIPMLHELAKIARPLGDIATGTVYLTPPPETDVRNPLTQVIAPGDAYRSTRDMRSFSIAMGDGGVLKGPEYSLDSVTVKGGDVLHMSSLLETLPVGSKHRRGLVWRLQNHQIPGAALRGEATREAAASNQLHARALELLGRPTYTAVSLGVHAITAVDAYGRGMMPIIDYMNSEDYLQLTPSERARAQVPSGMGLGHWLLEENGLEPAVYTYAVNGHNVRVDTLVNGRHIGGFNDDPGPRLPGEFHLPLHPGVIEPLKPELFSTIGDEQPPQPWLRGAVLHAAYGALGNAYGFDTAELLPPVEAVTYPRYRQVLEDLPQKCEAAGIPELVMPTFLNRLTEVLALTHSQGATLSNDAFMSLMGGSMAPRNVTLCGVVLDLDTYGRCDEVPERDKAKALATGIRQDCVEMLETICLLQRMIAQSHPADVVADARRLYAENLEAFGTDPALRDRLVAIMNSDGVVPY